MLVRSEWDSAGCYVLRVSRRIVVPGGRRGGEKKGEGEQGSHDRCPDGAASAGDAVHMRARNSRASSPTAVV